MQLEHIAGIAFDRIFGRILRRALLLCLIAALAVVALFHFTAAGTLMLEGNFSVTQAQLIVAAIYAAFALTTLAIWWGTARKAATSSKAALATPREMQMAILVEAVMLGYALAGKGERAS